MIQADGIVTAFEELKAEVEPLLFLASDTGLQEHAAQSARLFVDLTDSLRVASIAALQEVAANDLLGLGAIGRAFVSELGMYMLLKAGESENAWNSLIDAQDYIVAAGRASSSLTNLSEKFSRLREMEAWFFPPQAFMSVGMLVHEQHCSICSADYTLCNHVVGRPYMGRLCSLKLMNGKLDHVAVVEDPADRRCRITTFGERGGQRNRMTWLLTPSEVEAETMNAVLMHNLSEEADFTESGDKSA